MKAEAFKGGFPPTPGWTQASEMILRQVQQLVAIQVHHGTFKLGTHLWQFGHMRKKFTKNCPNNKNGFEKKTWILKRGGSKIDDLRGKKKQRGDFLLMIRHERIFAKVLVFVVLLVVQPIWKIYVKIYYSPNLWVEITIYLKPPTSLVGFCGSLSSCKPKKSTFLSMRHQFANKFAPHLFAVDGKKLCESCPTLKMLGYFFLQKS